ncbi:hypothetical protein [Virgibacillus litoralis]|uniref:DUF3221 domain-containing protein n=1 Tax=Virgibacillus litoralis TaxID=578221 RepID=A0ABS4HAI6_9BACI|nr:hypothetical protein [Virgibacillus litoralis]MBP1947462.1 hypothetical protein [Virgibacillus litoralis]
MRILFVFTLILGLVGCSNYSEENTISGDITKIEEDMIYVDSRPLKVKDTSDFAIGQTVKIAYIDNTPEEDWDSNDFKVKEIINIDSDVTKTFEEQIQEQMVRNGFLVEDIIDYEVKDNYIFVVGLSADRRLKEAILKNRNGQLEWIKGRGRATYFSAKGSPVMTLKTSTDSNMEGVKQVKVFGEPAKQITYYKEITGDYPLQIKFWIAVTEEPPTGKNDIKYIKD